MTFTLLQMGVLNWVIKLANPRLFRTSVQLDLKIEHFPFGANLTHFWDKSESPAVFGVSRWPNRQLCLNLQTVLYLFLSDQNDDIESVAVVEYESEVFPYFYTTDHTEHLLLHV